MKSTLYVYVHYFTSVLCGEVDGGSVGQLLYVCANCFCTIDN